MRKNPVALVRKSVLLVPAHPSYYPHARRHAEVLGELSCEVVVAGIHRPDEDVLLPKGVRVHPADVRMPSGFAGFLRLMLGNWRVLRREQPDLVEAIDPPSLIPAALWCSLTGAGLLYFSMELYPELPSLHNRPVRRWIWLCLETLALRMSLSAPVVTVCGSVAEKLSAMHGRAVAVVRNVPEQRKEYGADIRRLARAQLRQDLGLPSQARIVAYQGKLEDGRGLRAAVEALSGRSDVHLVIWGHGPLQEWLSLQAASWSNVHYCGALPFAQLMDAAMGADVGLVFIEPVSESYRLSLPGKLFDYLQNRLPILGSPLPEIQAVIAQYRVGVVADGFTADDLVRALKLLWNVMESVELPSALEHAAEELCWERERTALLDALMAAALTKERL